MPSTSTRGWPTDMSDPSSNDADALVFPVGHYMGPFHPKSNAPVQHHIVRVGWDTPKLPDEAHLDVWALAHGRPNAAASVRWTRQAIIDTAAQAEIPGAAEILDTLAERGLIAEVSSGPGKAREFAEAYRIQSLMIGLGNTPEDPVLDGIGLAGIPPVVKVRPRIFEFWQWAHLWPNLWAACEGLAWVAAQAQDGRRPEESDPETLLDFILEALRVLISHNAVYLDVATAPRSDATSSVNPPATG